MAGIEKKERTSRAISRVLCRRSARCAMAQRCLSFIYGVCRHTSLSFYPLTCLAAGTGRPPCNASLYELSASGVHSPCVATRLVGSYPTFSPLPAGFPLKKRETRRRLFSSALANPREFLPVKKRSALCCPDFPLAPQGRKRQTARLVSIFLSVFCFGRFSLSVSSFQTQAPP